MARGPIRLNNAPETVRRSTVKEEDVKYAAEAITDLVKSGEANRADKSGKSGKNVPRERYDGARRPERIPGQYRTVALGIANEIATN